MSTHAARPKRREPRRTLACLLFGCWPSPKRPDGFDWYFITCVRCKRYL